MSEEMKKEAAVEIRRFFAVAWEHCSVDTVMHRGKAAIFSIVLSSDGVAEADAVVYDGASAEAKKYVKIYCADEETYQLRFAPPLVFNNGIYVDVGTNVDQVIVQYQPLPQ